jgi:EAL domain-containing protein (putative c-di-GMP-specific phosphodiesterase class I)
MIPTSTLHEVPPASMLGAAVPTQRRVLLVDDEPGVLLMFKIALESHGFVTVGARDGNEALAALAGGRFDVVVSDINMPGCSGMEFLKQVREMDLDVPVILMTGRPSLESSNTALEHGAFRYLQKPVLPKTLREVIERAARLHELARLKRAALELLGTDGKWLGERAALETRFAKAMAGLWIAFQPIVSLRSRGVYGYEALVRTVEPTIPHPGALLDAAERLGKLPELGRAIRRLAAAVPPPDGAKLFVNLHAADLTDEDLYDPASPLAKLGDRVVLEVTERAAVDHIKDLESRVAKLRSLGFKIAIDDLGAGYAGLTSFTQFNPDVAKLDMSLVRNIHAQGTKQSIVRSMRKLCEELGVLVIAEGVETSAERDTLADLGCDVLQGYLFSKPGRGFPIPNWE